MPYVRNARNTSLCSDGSHLRGDITIRGRRYAMFSSGYAFTDIRGRILEAKGTNAPDAKSAEKDGVMALINLAHDEDNLLIYTDCEYNLEDLMYTDAGVQFRNIIDCRRGGTSVCWSPAHIGVNGPVDQAAKRAREERWQQKVAALKRVRRS
ncbi:hypothetical protein HK097_001564 [Rhizophlyctis rosea]|uniref:RNase H type-1 domain-containing protein n=1 Tax=Rhizophlyctis rosea TaxID=64517 RepID=A0AAD5SHL0_9FUNG|nr:hypothetical protein HK097_001564 [Rhizophlyctis rosea]